MTRFQPAACFFLSVVLFTACKKENDPEPNPNPITTTVDSAGFKIDVDHTFGNQSFVLEQPYTNSSNEDVTFNNLRYYISNIRLTKSDGTIWSQPESYYLVDESVSGSDVLNLAGVPAGSYQSVSYMIGVDSARNVSGAQTGALSVSNDMFWSWNSGYIFFKVEGESAASPAGTFAYHVGGFSGSKNALGIVTHDFGSTPLVIKKNTTPTLNLAFDVAHIFSGPDAVSVATLYGIHMPGSDAVSMANNFRSGFSFTGIQ